MPDTNAPVQDDSIGGLLRANFEKASESAPAAESGAAPAAEVSAPAEKVVEKPVEAAAPAKTDAAPAPNTSSDTPEQKEQKARLDRIPPGWRGGAAAYHALPVDVKQFVADTNRNAAMKIQQDAPAVKFANDIYAVFKPHEGFMRAQGTNPIEAAQWLMDGYITLRTGSAAQKYQIIQNLAAEAGLDLKSIQAGDAPRVDPEVEKLRAELARVTQHLTQQHQTAESAEQASIAADLQAFENDPAHEHFPVVRGEMAALLMSGQARGLQDAYDKACWAHPDIRSSLVNKQIAQETEKRKKEAEKATNAGVSLTGAPSSGSGSPSLSDMGLRESLEHQFRVASRV